MHFQDIEKPQEMGVGAKMAGYEICSGVDELGERCCMFTIKELILMGRFFILKIPTNSVEYLSNTFVTYHLILVSSRGTELYSR